MEKINLFLNSLIRILKVNNARIFIKNFFVIMDPDANLYIRIEEQIKKKDFLFFSKNLKIIKKNLFLIIKMLTGYNFSKIQINKNSQSQKF